MCLIRILNNNMYDKILYNFECKKKKTYINKLTMTHFDKLNAYTVHIDKLLSVVAQSYNCMHITIVYTVSIICARIFFCYDVRFCFSSTAI